MTTKPAMTQPEFDALAESLSDELNAVVVIRLHNPTVRVAITHCGWSLTVGIPTKELSRAEDALEFVRRVVHDLDDELDYLQISIPYGTETMN